MDVTVAARRLSVGIALAAALGIVTGCGAAGGSPTWTFGPSASGGTPVAAASAVPAASASVEPSAAATFALTAIDFTPGTVAAPRVVKLTADDALNFVPGGVTAARGETVTFEIANIGKAEHEFMIGPVTAAFGDVEGTSEVAGIKAGKTGSVTVTFDKPGQYAFACHMPGHYEHGMLGFVVFVGPDVPALGTVADPRPIVVNMTDKLAFTPNAIQVRKGETVRFVLTNSGTVTHEFMIGPADKVAADEGDGKITIEADKMDAGSTTGLVYTFDGSGPYTFACHEPGHYEAGMLGTIELLD